MDITKSTNKIFTTKFINGETVNYSACYSVCVLLFLVLKQVFKLAFGISANIAVGVSFGIAAIVLYFLEKKYVFTHNAKTKTPLQIILYLFRCFVDVGFFFICRFFMCSFLNLKSFVPFFVSIFLFAFFNYFFDRLIVFNCGNKAIDNKNGKLYKLFFNNRFVLLSSVTAVISMLFIYFLYHLFPFGDTTVMRMDLYHQYGPLFSELYDRVLEHKSFLYSWQSGGGSSFLGNYFNYLSSPLSAIIFLFGRKHIDYAITTLVLLKGVISAGTFAYYLKKSVNRHSYASAGFGVFYAFCSYFLAYYWNIMWIDGMMLLPLIILGIERIMKKGKAGLYIASLTLLLYSSYYMGYMVCIFSALYFIAYYFISNVPSKINSELPKKKNVFIKAYNNTFINRGITFAFSSVLCAMLCACALIPVYMLLQSSSATSGTFPSAVEFNFDLLDFIKSQIANLETTIRSSGDDVLPNVYSGMLAAILLPLYFLNKDIRLKEKASYLVLMLFLVFSFDINMLDYIWHAMHFPNDLPFRYSFIYSFIYLVLGYRTLMHIKALRYQDIAGAGLFWVFLIMLFQKNTTTKMQTNTIYVTLAFIIIWTGVLLLIKKQKFNKFVIGITIIAMTFCEVIVADSGSFVFDVKDAGYVQNYDFYRESTKYLKQKDNSFYRSELCYLDTRMDPCTYGYDGISVFSSMAYEDYSQNQYSLGMMSNRINSYTYNTQTPVYNMMYAIKYLTQYNNSIELNTDIYKHIYTTKDSNAKIYENKYYLPIGYMTQSDIKNWDNDEGNPFEVQEDFINKATGVSNVFIPAEYVTTETTNAECDEVTENGTYFVQKNSSESNTGSVDITIRAVSDGDLYIYVSSSDINNINYYWNNREDTHYQSSDEPYIMDLGKHKAGDEVVVSLDLSSMENTDANFDIYAYGIDSQVLDKAYNILSGSVFNVTKHSDTALEGTIDASYDGYLYTSIPYDEGWSVYVDGQKQKTFKIGDSQLGITMKKGKHTVKFKYTPKGLYIGLAGTGAGWICLAGYLIIKKKTLKNHKLKS